VAVYVHTEPTTEPVTVTELSEHLRLDIVSDTLIVSQSIKPASYNPSTVTGANVALFSLSPNVAYAATVVLNVGVVATGGNLAVKIQDSNDAQTWTDAIVFGTVTETTDETAQDQAYTGEKLYLRAVATVSGAAAVFAVNIQLQPLLTTETTLLAVLIKAARRYAEIFTRRQFVTATLKLVLDKFPKVIYVPRPPLISVTPVEYADSAGVTRTLSEASYVVDIRSEPGRIVEAYGVSWPTTRDIINAVTVTYQAGYGAASAVPASIKTAIKMLAAHWYEHREAVTDGRAPVEVPMAVESLLWMHRVKGWE